MRGLNIAIIGTRGIPANYGGFETFAQELSDRMVRRGHHVSVYCRRHYFRHDGPEFRGVRLVILPAIRHKYFDTVSHSVLSLLHSLFRPYDAVLVCNAANAAFCWLPHLRGRPVVLNVDGLERKRKKWNFLGRGYYRISEWLAGITASAVVTDAATIQDYFRRRYGRETVMIPYGSEIAPHPPGQTLADLEVSPGEYYLYVSRLEPENNAHLVVAMFERLRTPRPLLVVGDAPYSRGYITRLKETRDPRIRFTGAIYGNGYRELVSNARAYIHATEIGGTHPALVENMAAGNLVFCLDTPENREVLGPAGLFFPAAPLEEGVARWQEIEDHPDQHQPLRAAAARRAREFYSWDKVTDAYEALFQRLVGGPDKE